MRLCRIVSGHRDNKQLFGSSATGSERLINKAWKMQRHVLKLKRVVRPTQGSGVTAEWQNLHLQLDSEQHLSFRFTVTRVEISNVLDPNINDQVIISFS